jgi:hypothetical protein
LQAGATMRRSVDLDDFLPGDDWQRLETWAAIAGMTPLDYLRQCVRRGHAVLREELSEHAPVGLRPLNEGDPSGNRG